MKKGKTYIDLLTDEEFKSWVLNPIFEKNLFWEKQFNQNENLRKEAKKAKELILRLNFKEKPLDDNEKNILLENILAPKKIISQKSTYRASKWSTVNLIKFAACVVILLAVGYTVNFNKIEKTPDKNVSVNIISRKTPKGVKTNLSLPDGSKVKVNANSEIRFPDSYLQASDRTVFLKGEAFFDVKKNKIKPFKVLTEKLEIQVLGTSFDVKCYPSFNKVYIAVVEGKVEVKSELESIVLTPGEMGVVDQGKIMVMPFDKEEILGWKDGILYYKDENFDEVLQKLEYWYGVEFEINGNRRGLTHFSGKYQNKPLTTVLKGLSFAAGFKYSINDNKVTINF